MKICFVPDTLPPILGGSAIFAKSLLEELKKKGNEFFIVAPTTFVNIDSKNAGMEILPNPFPYPWQSPSNLFSFVSSIARFLIVLFKGGKFFRSKKIDLIITDSFIQAIVCRMIKKFTGKPLVLCLFLISSNMSFGKLLFAVEKAFFRRLGIDEIICWSSFLQEEHLRLCGIRNAIYVPCWIDTEKFSPHVTSDIKDKYGIKGNLLITNKQLYLTNALGIQYTIRALPMILEENPNTYLMLLGEGVGKPLLQHEAQKFAVKDFVIFTGHVEHTEMPRFLAAADVIIHSYAYESGASVSVLEAMSMGKPNVVTKCGELAKMLNDTEVMFVESKNPQSIAMGVTKLLKNPLLSHQLGHNSRLRVEKDHSINTAISRLEKILSKYALSAHVSRN